MLFSPENILAALVVLAVSLGTYVFYPEYFTITYPLVRDLYLSPSMPVSVIFLNDATLVTVIAMLSVLLARQRAMPDPLLPVAVLASIGFAVSFFLQRKGWAYHSYPMVALALLAMGYVLTGVNDARPRPRLLELASSFVLAVTFLLGTLSFNGNVYIGPIREAIAGLKPHPRILMLSGEAAIGHPLVRDVGGVWVSRQSNLWLREFVRLTRETTSVDAATDARLNDYLALERRWLIEDFRKLPPDIVLVDNLRDGWGDWARADAEISDFSSRMRWYDRSRDRYPAPTGRMIDEVRLKALGPYSGLRPPARTTLPHFSVSSAMSCRSQKASPALSRRRWRQAAPSSRGLQSPR